MKPGRKLALRREALDDLVTDELSSIAGGPQLLSADAASSCHPPCEELEMVKKLIGTIVNLTQTTCTTG